MVGTTWQVGANIAAADGAKVATLLPTEGATGWSDTWMIGSKTKNPNCAYKWLDYIASPKANAAVARYFGESPANPKACELTKDKAHCETYHSGDEAYAKQIWYWNHPGGRLPGRPQGRQVHGLLGVDEGLDRNQGLRWRSSRSSRPRGLPGRFRRAPAEGQQGLGAAPPLAKAAAGRAHHGPRRWLVLVYIAALAALLITAFWTVDTFTGKVSTAWTTDNLVTVVTDPSTSASRCGRSGSRFAVTVIDLILALPMAFFIAKVASARWQKLLVVAVLMPLWASYLVKAYAWRNVLADGGLLEWLGAPLGLQSPGYSENGRDPDAVLYLAAVYDPADLRRV